VCVWSRVLREKVGEITHLFDLEPRSESWAKGYGCRQTCSRDVGGEIKRPSPIVGGIEHQTERVVAFPSSARGPEILPAWNAFQLCADWSNACAVREFCSRHEQSGAMLPRDHVARVSRQPTRREEDTVAVQIEARRVLDPSALLSSSLLCFLLLAYLTFDDGVSPSYPAPLSLRQPQ
jgi:hypothetical protein